MTLCTRLRWWLCIPLLWVWVRLPEGRLDDMVDGLLFAIFPGCDVMWPEVYK